MNVGAFSAEKWKKSDSFHEASPGLRQPVDLIIDVLCEQLCGGIKIKVVQKRTQKHRIPQPTGPRQTGPLLNFVNVGCRLTFGKGGVWVCVSGFTIVHLWLIANSCQTVSWWV